MSADQLARRRDTVLRQLKGISLGRSAALAATMDEQGAVVTEGSAMADALRKHWEPTFARKHYCVA